MTKEQPNPFAHQETQLAKEAAAALGLNSTDIPLDALGTLIWQAYTEKRIEFSVFDALLSQISFINRSKQEIVLAFNQAHWQEVEPLAPPSLHQLNGEVDQIVSSPWYLESMKQLVPELRSHSTRSLERNPAIIRSTDTCPMQVALLHAALANYPNPDLSFHIALGSTYMTLFHYVVAGVSKDKDPSIENAALFIDPSIMQLYDEFQKSIPSHKRIKHMQSIAKEGSVTPSGVLLAHPLDYESFLNKLVPFYGRDVERDYAEFAIMSPTQERRMKQEFGIDF